MRAMIACAVKLLVLISLTPAQADDLLIERVTRTPRPDQQADGLPSAWVQLGEDRFAAHFRIPPELMFDRATIADDPFAVDGEPAKLRPAREILESAGVQFPEGASAEFMPETSMLRVINTREQLRLVEYFIGLPRHEPRLQLAVRTEIYELTNLQALQLLESATAQGDHRPERDAALKATRDGSAKLVALHHLVTAPGQRAKVDDVIEFIPPVTSGAASPGDDASKSRPKQDKRWNYGTVLEVEPMLDPDGDTLSLNIALEHHTAEPEISTSPVPRFHLKRITTNVSFSDGDFVLLGTWRPSGRPHHKDSELCHVVFVTAALQTAGDYGKVEIIGGGK